MPHRTRQSDIATAGIPLHGSHAVVLQRREHSHTSARWAFFLTRILRALLSCFAIDIDIPEFDFEFACRSKSSEDTMSATGRPVNFVGRATFNSLEVYKIAFAWIKLIEAYTRLDGRAECVGAECRIIRSDQSKSIAFWLPRKFDDLILDLDDLDWDLLFSHSEQLKV